MRYAELVASELAEDDVSQILDELAGRGNEWKSEYVPDKIYHIGETSQEHSVLAQGLKSRPTTDVARTDDGKIFFFSHYDPRYCKAFAGEIFAHRYGKVDPGKRTLHVPFTVYEVNGKALRDTHKFFEDQHNPTGRSPSTLYTEQDVPASLIKVYKRVK